MKKVLFIVNAGTISPNENGGAAVYYSHLELLHSLGYEVVVLVVLWDELSVFNKKDYAEIASFVTDIKVYQSKRGTLKKGLYRWIKAIVNPAAFEYAFVNPENTQFLQTLVKKDAIDLVWCEWRWAAIWASTTSLKIPIVYAHHDWEYKLAKLRSKRTLLQQFHTYQKKRVEFDLIKKVTATVSGSYTESQEIKTISNKNTLYLPTTYQTVTPNLLPLKEPNIVHLGGMGTTANRIGLERFIDVCWQDIKNKNPSVRLMVIGSIAKATLSLKEKLKDTRIVCKGFVKDLNTVLHPNDIHIIPWEYNTGTRTRLPVIFNYQQLLVATKASVAAFPEVMNDKNALLCTSLEQMTLKINKLLYNTDSIAPLTKEAKKTFTRCFTAESQAKKLKEFIDTISI